MQNENQSKTPPEIPTQPNPHNPSPIQDPDPNENNPINPKTDDRLDRYSLGRIFNLFAKEISVLVGSAWTFIFALLVIIFWAISGHYFNYSNAWQLVINTGTTIITFLMVFLIQNTQNRFSEIINLKIDELIRAKKNASNRIINLDKLTDVELQALEKEYIKLCSKEN